MGLLSKLCPFGFKPPYCISIIRNQSHKSSQSFRLLLSSTPLVSRTPRMHLTTFRTKPFASKKSIVNFHVQDGMNPKVFTLVYKTDFDWYMIGAQTCMILALGAFFTVLAAAIVESQIPVEERERMKKERVAALQEEERKRRKEATWNPKQLGPGEVANLPSIADMVEKDKEMAMVVFVLLVSLTFSIRKLMTMVPIRIYVGKKDFCVGVYYGSILPGKTSRQEFVAGTLVPHPSRYGVAEVAWKDASGRSMVLLDRFFRRPSDFDYLRGITKGFDPAEYQEEFEQMKASGEMGIDQHKENKKMDRNG